MRQKKVVLERTDLDVWTAGPNTSIRDVAKQLNDTQLQFCVIVDSAGTLMGTVTDGDIRRSLLTGKTLDHPIEQAMNRTARYLRETDLSDASRLIDTFRFIPVLNYADCVVKVLVHREGARVLCAALIMAGGRGSRLGSHTKSTPKPLVSVGGKPILERVMQGIETTDAQQIFISVSYLADQIAKFVEERDNKVDITLIPEKVRLGTAGAIGLLPPLDGSLLVMNGDVVSDANLASAALYHDQNRYDITIAVAGYEVNIPFGVVQIDPDGQFSGLNEKPRNTYYVAAGIYFLQPHVCNLVPQNEPMDMPELLNRARGLGMKIGVYPIHEYWRDIGNPTDLEAARNDKGPSGGAE